MSELSAALSNPATGAAITTFARTALAVTAAAVLAPEVATIIAVGGAYVAVGAAYYAWKQAQNDQLQQLAVTGICSGSSPVPSCGDGYIVEFYDPNNAINTKIYVYPNAQWTGYSPLVEGNKYHAVYQYRIRKDARGRDVIDGLKLIDNARTWVDGLHLVDVSTIKEFPINRKPWSEWTQAEREAAIRNLSDDQWNQILSQIEPAGTLQPGQTLPNDVITLGNAQVQPAGTKVLTAEQQALREAIKPELDKINSDLAKNAAAIAAIAGTLGLAGATIGNIDRNVANLGNVATQTKQAVDGVGQKVDAAAKQSNENFNKVRKRLSSIASFLNFDRILNVLIWINTLHNAFMLSADLARSLLSMVSTSLKALPGNSLLGLPTESEDGSPLDLATTINKSVEGWIKGAIGAKNYKLMTLQLAQINRIYQSTANISSDVTSIFDSFRQPLALGIERISIVANALRRNGVVRDDSYSPMSERVNIRSKGLSRIDRVTQGLEALSNATSAVESVASNVISIQEEVAEIKKYRKEYEDEKTRLSKEIEKKETDSKKVSSAPDIKEEDEERHAA